MNTFQVSILCTLVINTLLAFVVFFTNTKRTTNRLFLVLCLTGAVWLTCLLIGSLATEKAAIMFWIRATSIVAPLVLTGFNLLRLSFVHKDETVLQIVVRARYWFYLYAAVGLLCLTRFFLYDATPPHDFSVVAEPVYGPAFPIYVMYWLVTSGILILSSIRNMRQLSGMQRVELQFSLLGYAVGLSFGMGLVLIAPLFTGNIQPAQFAPFSVVVLDGVIAYGVATRRIMGVGEVLRRLTTYAFLSAYLAVVYLLVWWISLRVLAFYRVPPGFPIPTLMAALVVALSMASAHGRMRTFANRLFMIDRSTEISGTIQQAHEVLRSIDTLEGLLMRLARIIEGAAGADRVIFLLLSGDRYEQRFPPATANGQDFIRLTPDDPLVRELNASSAPLVADDIRRMRSTPRLTEVNRRLDELKVNAAIPIRSRGKLEGILLLGPRLWGSIYGVTEQDTFLLLCDQIAVALENTRLYTQIRRSDRLASLGTLAAGMAHEIKNPLVTIKTFTQLLPERYDDKDFRDTFSSLIGQEVRRIDTIVNQLLNFARPVAPNLSPIHLHNVVKSSLHLLEQQFRQKRVAVQTTLTASVDAIDGDSSLLEQVFVNVLLNAIESMVTGGRIHVSSANTGHDLPSIHGPRKGPNGHIQLSIQDSGSGISPEDLSHVFDPFFTTKSSGTGLGLSVAHSIIREHGGAIDVESEAGKGSVFHVVLPLRREDTMT